MKREFSFIKMAFRFFCSNSLLLSFEKVIFIFRKFYRNHALQHNLTQYFNVVYETIVYLRLLILKNI